MDGHALICGTARRRDVRISSDKEQSRSETVRLIHFSKSSSILKVLGISFLDMVLTSLKNNFLVIFLILSSDVQTQQKPFIPKCESESGSGYYRNDRCSLHGEQECDKNRRKTEVHFLAGRFSFPVDLPVFPCLPVSRALTICLELASFVGFMGRL